MKSLRVYNSFMRIQGIVYFSVLFIFLSCENTQKSSSSGSGGGSTVNSSTEVELTVGDISTLASTYNFYYKTRDNFALTSDKWDLLAVDDTTDTFQVSLGAYDRAQIVDLGAKNCTSVALSSAQQTDYAADLKGGTVSEGVRSTNPDFWIGFTDAMRSLQSSGSTSATITLDHCYFMTTTTAVYTVMALFYVKKIDTTVTPVVITLSQMEWFHRKAL